MKKFTLIIFGLLLSFNSYAQLPLESFEAPWVGSPAHPVNWTVINEAGPTYTWVQTTAGSTLQPPKTGNHAAYLAREDATPVPKDWLITPYFNMPVGAQLRFFSRLTQPGDQGGIYKVKISTNPDPSDLASYTDLQTWTEPNINPVQTTYYEKIITLPAITGFVHIAFVMEGNNCDRWLIDDVKVVTQCLPPITLSATNIDLDSADLTWISQGGGTSWNVEVVLSSQSPTGSGDVHIGPPPFTKTGLLPDTEYKYYIYAICGDGGESITVGPFFFNTAAPGESCGAPIIIPTILPYATTNNTANFTDFYEGTPGTSCNATGNFLAGNDVVYEYTPTISGNINISMTNNGPGSGLFVYDNCTDIGVSCLAGGTGSATTPVIIPSFAVTANNTYYIVISTSTAAATTPYTLTLQQVYCAAPTGLTASDANATSAKLTWTTGVASSWEVAVQPANTGIPTGAGQTTSQNTAFPVTQTTSGDLFTPATNYEYWVRASCGNGTFSIWTGPYYFSTTQIPATLNYVQDFEAASHGWSLNNGTQPNKWTVGSATQNGGVKSLYVSNDNSITNAYTINIASVVQAYRDVQIPNPVNQLNLSFDYKGIGDTADYFRIWLVPTSYIPIAGTQITTANSGGIQIGGNFTTTPAWTSYNGVINASAFAGQIRRLVFEWRNDAFGGTQGPAAIDNINLSVITCSAPTSPVIATNSLTDSQVTINWTPPTSTVPGYDYYLSSNPTAPTGTTTPTNTAAITGPTTTITTLTPSNSYYFWVRSNCGPGDASTWTGPLSFVAPQVPAAMNYVQNFDIGAHGWALNNGTQTNKWAVGPATSNSAANSLYISEDNGTTNTYNINAQSVVQAYRDIQMPVGLNQLLLSFDWKNVGENNNDYFRVWIVPATFVPTPGTQITAATDRIQIGGNFMQNGTWTNQTNIINAAALSNSIRRLVFEWRNNNGTGTQAPAAIDNINLSVITCIAPTAPVIATNSLTNNQVIINWTPPVTTVPGYDYYLSSNPTPPTGATVPTNTTAISTPTVTITTLTPSNSYYFWVRSNCGPGDTSIWTGPLSFVAPQVPAAMDYTQNFDLGTHGWALNNGTQTNKWAVGTATSNSAANSLYISEDNGVTNTYNINALSVVQAYRDIQMPVTLDQLLLSFDWKNVGENNTDYFRVWIVPATFVPTPGTQITAAADRIQIGGNYMQNGTWTTQTNVINAAALNNSIRRLVFEWRNSATVGTQAPAAIDNISLKVITCPQPSNIIMAGLEPGIATFTWTATTVPPASYDYYVSTDPTAPTATTIPTGNSLTPTAIVNGLPPSTNQNIWVRSRCSDTDKSFWIGPLNFTTPQVPATMNYIQNFDLGIHGWDLVNGTQTNKWVVGTATSNSATNSLYVSNDNGVTNAYTNTAGSVVQAYRDIQLPTTLDQLLLTFNWKGVGDVADYFRIWMVPINYTPVAGTQITAGTGRVQIGGNFTNNNSWVTSNTIIPSAANAGQIRRLVFEWRNDTFGGTTPPAAIDNISLSVVTCVAPTNLLMPTLTATSATFTWTPPASVPPSYEYYYSLSGTPPTAGTTPTDTTLTPTVTLNGLPDSSNFFFWVRSNCGPTDKSLWLGPFEFSTPQVPSPLNYNQNFDGPTYGWTIVNGNQTNRWVVGSAVNNSPSKSLYVTNDGGANNTYTVNSASVVHAYKDITIPAGTAELDLSFDWKNLGETPNWDVIRVWRVPQNFVPTTGAQITAGVGREQIGGEFVGNGNWTTANYILNSSAYPTTIRLVFEWRNDTTLGTGSGGAIDNVDLSIITCPKPTTLGVTAIGQTGATFNWTEVGTAPAWEVYVVPAGSPAPTATSNGVAAPTNPYVYTTPALNASTNYVYYVRSVCSTTDKSKWSGPVAFKTKIANDECIGAYTLGVNAQGDDCLVSLITSYDGSTPSAQPFECATTNGADIWYQFVATEDRHNVELSSFTGEPNPVVIALYEGDQCGSLLQLNCSTTNVLIGQNLIPGNTYKVRLILNKTAPVLTTEYKICINTPEPPAGENQSACTVTTINYGFENPVPLTVSPYPQMINQNTVQGWRTTASDDVMEFWPTPNYENVNAYEGSQFIELNANLVSGIYQDYPTPQSTAFNYSFAHRGRQGTDTCKLLAGPPGGPYVDVTTATTTNTAWALYTGSYTTPANQPITRFIFQSVSSVGGVSVGNWLDAIEFTANNSVLSVSPSVLNCIDNMTTVTAAGSGEWSAHADNPAETVITNAESNTTTIGGFTANGIYRYDWVTQYCSSTIEVTFDNGNVALPVVTPTVEYCINETAVPLTATSLADHTLQWYTTPTGGTASTTAPTPDTTIDSVVTYYVAQLSNSNCESQRVAIEVTVHALPLAPVTTAAIEYCQNTTPAPLTADVLAGHTLNWYTVPTGGTPSATAPIVNTTLAGVTTYYVSQTSAQSCEGDRAIITVTVKPSIVPVTDFTLVNNVCITEANPVVTLNTGSTAGGHYSAEPGLTIDTVTGEIDLTTSTAGTYLVTYTVDPDPTVCNIGNSSSVSITVTPLTAAVTTFSYTTPVCTTSANQTPVLATGFTVGGTFTSSDAGLVIDISTGAIDIAASTIGSYTVTYNVAQNTTNCMAAGNGIATIEITQTITPVTDFDFDPSFCFGATNATPNLATDFVTGGTFTGTTGLVIDATTGQIDIAGSTPGIHTVTYTVAADPTNCNTGNTSKDTFTINGQIDFSLDGKCNGSTFIVTATPAEGSFITSDVTYEWATASGKVVGLNSENFDVSDYVNSTPENEEFPLEFTLTVISNGCEVTKSYIVEDIACAIQKGISPNGDGLNDNFDLKFMGVKKLSIFNRYGQDVYTKANYKDEWYGQSSNGNELPTGTYYYVIERSVGGTTTGWIYINRQE